MSATTPVNPVKLVEDALENAASPETLVDDK